MYSEIQHNNLYISVSRQNVCPKELAIVMTLVSKTTFLNPLRGGTFSNLMRYGDIPSSHGDIPVVSLQIHISKTTKIGSFKISTIWSICKGTPSIGDASFLACAFI